MAPNSVGSESGCSCTGWKRLKRFDNSGHVMGVSDYPHPVFAKHPTTHEWALVVYEDQPAVAGYIIRITHCPFCGEKLT